MSIIAEVKCARCDRKYSGVRSRCPYCGARRIGSGKYSEEGDSNKGRMIIAILIMAVLVVATGALLFTTPQPDEPEDLSMGLSEDSHQDLPDDLQNTSLEGTGPEVPSVPEEPEEPPEEPVPPTPQVQSVTITYAGSTILDFTEPVGERIPLRVRVEPPGAEFEEDVVWTSGNTSVFEVVKDNTEGTSAMVTIIGSGSVNYATLTVTVGGVEAQCIVRVRR